MREGVEEGGGGRRAGGEGEREEMLGREDGVMGGGWMSGEIVGGSGDLEVREGVVKEEGIGREGEGVTWVSWAGAGAGAGWAAAGWGAGAGWAGAGWARSDDRPVHGDAGVGNRAGGDAHFHRSVGRTRSLDPGGL